MLKNYLKIAARTLLRHKTYSFINIAGLSMGLTCCFLIVLYVADELSYDRYHDNADRIYRVVMKMQGPVAPYVAHTSLTLASRLKDSYQEIARLIRYSEPTVSYNEKQFNENRFFYGDQRLLDIFTFRFIKGHPQSALVEPNTLIITASTAKRYFGDADPIGKLLAVNTRKIYKITAVIEDIPAQSHFHFDFLASLSSLGEITDPYQYWGHTYVLLPAGFPPQDLEQKLVEITNQESLGWYFEGMKFKLQPITRIHLFSHFNGEIEPNSDVRYIFIFASIALLILIIACVNYSNLATACFSQRAKEVGIRKVFGSHRLNLILQFLGESIFICFFAAIIALTLIELLLPAFNNLVQRSISLDYRSDSGLLAGIAVLTLLVGIGAGWYPAFFLSSFRSARVLRGLPNSGLGAVRLQKILILLQFTITIALLVGTIAMQRQMSYIQHKWLGYEKENTVVLPIAEASLRQQYELFKNELLQNPSIVHVSAASGPPFEAGLIAAFGQSRLHVIMADHDYIATLGIELVQGRNFSPDMPTDTAAFILSEATVRALQQEDSAWTSPLGRTFRTGFGDVGRKGGVVIGVINDFHNNSLHKAIEPAALQFNPEMFFAFLIKIKPEDTASTLNFLKQKWQAFLPDRPFEYTFLDERYGNLYHGEQRLRQIVGAFTFFAIFVSCLGLFGLTAYAAERRTKEIGIRKVLGATVANVVALLSKDLVKLVLLANVIAWPIAWIAMNKWLQNFAYRIDIGWWVFALAGGLALVIALLMVSTQAIRAALANPVESLRYE